MKKTAVMLAAALCVATALPVYADMSNPQRDECLLASRNCANAVDDIQTQIRRLSAEIDKGTAVYTPEELKKLQAKLNDVKDMLETMMNKN